MNDIYIRDFLVERFTIEIPIHIEEFEGIVLYKGKNDIWVIKDDDIFRYYLNSDRKTNVSYSDYLEYQRKRSINDIIC